MLKYFDSDFFIPLEIKKAPHSISIKDRLILLGSCFADNIGDQLSHNKFKVLVNPTGVIYNPYSLFKLIIDSLKGIVDEDRMIVRDGAFFYLDAHSSIWAPSKVELLKLLHEKLELTRTWLSRASTLIFSLGTSYVYFYSKSGDIVANCHKIPGREFSKKLLAVDEIVKGYHETMHQIREVNPDIKIILTVSPVRHIRDGLVENNLSKSILIQAIHTILERDPQVSYFPSYELVTDVLRDYRFYKKDLIHPNEQAIEFIWKTFAETYFDQETLAFLADWTKILQALNHKPFHPHSEGHIKFLKELQTRLLVFKDIIEIKSELKAVEEQMKLS